MVVSRMKALLPITAFSLLASVAAVGRNHALSANEQQRAESAEPVEAGTWSSPAVVGGLVATIDPATGELVVGGEGIPDEVLADPALANALSTSSDGLVAVELPDGRGVMVHLQGRFQNVLFATVDAGGHARVGHQAPRRVVVPESEGPLCRAVTPASGGGHHERD